MRKFFSELIPTTPYLSIAQQEEDIQVIPISSELEEVLDSDAYHVQYNSQEQLIKTCSWDVKIQDALVGMEKKTEPLQADYRLWDCFSMANAALASLVPPATYTILWGLDAYISYPITHTPKLIQLTSQLQKTLLVFEPINSAYQYLHHQLDASFWNLIKIKGADTEIGRYNYSFTLLNNCFWKQGYQLYHNNTFRFPAGWIRLYSFHEGSVNILHEYELSNSNAPESICDYFATRSLIETNRTPSFEYCQSNLYDMCGNLTQLQQIRPDFDSLSEQLQQLEKAISAEGEADYHVISNTVFWSILILVSFCTMGWLMYLAYANYKNKQELNAGLEKLQNNPPQLDEQETKDMGEIINVLNRIMSGAPPLSLEEKTSIFTDRLICGRKKISNHFHFFKFCEDRLPKELIHKIGEYLYAADTSTEDEKPVLTL